MAMIMFPKWRAKAQICSELVTMTTNMCTYENIIHVPDLFIEALISENDSLIPDVGS